MWFDISFKSGLIWDVATFGCKSATVIKIDKLSFFEFALPDKLKSFCIFPWHPTNRFLLILVIYFRKIKTKIHWSCMHQMFPEITLIFPIGKVPQAVSLSFCTIKTNPQIIWSAKHCHFEKVDLIESYFLIHSLKKQSI